jgi:outer membrane receptor protein involved in Fe transport
MRKKLYLGFCAMVLFTITSMAQTVTVTGKVTDDKGAAIPGATILEKGTKTGTSANADGSFTLKVKPKATFLVSAIGYEDQRLEAGTNLKVQMVTDTKSLSEVVVTGVGVATSKKKLGFAVESIGAGQLPAAPTADVGSALVGKIAGAQISTTNGSPGSPVNILLRGVNSVRGEPAP